MFKKFLEFIGAATLLGCVYHAGKEDWLGKYKKEKEDN